MRLLRDDPLSAGEREVLILVGRGLTNQDIADQLCKSVSAIKLYVHRLCVKLGAPNRQQAAIEAMRTGVLVPQDIYSVEELAELLSFLGQETIEAVAPLLAQKLDQVESR